MAFCRVSITTLFRIGRPKALAALYRRDKERWGKSIFFQKSLNECYELFNLLVACGIRCDVVTGSSNRDEQLELFRRGDTDVLINCMVLTEGFDDPTLQTAFVRPSSRGPTIQMAGRALRKHNSIAFKNIVQGVTAKHPFTKTASPRQQYLMKDGEWLSLRINPKLNLCSQNARRAIATMNIELPKFMQKRQRRTRRRPAASAL